MGAVTQAKPQGKTAIDAILKLLLLTVEIRTLWVTDRKSPPPFSCSGEILSSDRRQSCYRMKGMAVDYFESKGGARLLR